MFKEMSSYSDGLLDFEEKDVIHHPRFLFFLKLVPRFFKKLHMYVFIALNVKSHFTSD